MRMVVVLLATLSVVACARSEPPAASAPAAGAAYAEPPVNSAPASESASEGPIRLDDDRLQKYIAYRRELHEAMRSFLTDVGTTARSADAKTTEVGKAFTALEGMSEAGQRLGAVSEALRRKHGFGEAEDQRLWDALGAVVAARMSENPMMAGNVKMFRDMQKQGGPTRQVADEFFRKMEEDEKRGLEEAAKQYGAECTAVLAKHVPELSALQMEGLAAAFGKAPSS